MIRIAAVSLLALGLLACGAPENAGTPLQGKWGWFSPDACEGNRDAIEFAGTRFTHWAMVLQEQNEGPPQLQQTIRRGRDTHYEENQAGWVTATYILDQPDGGEQTVALIFEPGSAGGLNVLFFRGALIDGAAPATAANVMGQPLFSCDGAAPAARR